MLYLTTCRLVHVEVLHQKSNSLSIAFKIVNCQIFLIYVGLLEAIHYCLVRGGDNVIMVQNFITTI